MSSSGLLVAFGGGSGACVGLIIGPVATRLSAGRAWRPILALVVLEAGLGAWGAGQFERWDMAAISVLLSATLLALALVDVAALRLPDLLTLPLAACGVALSGLERWDVGARMIGAMAGFLVLFALAAAFRRLRGREGMGLGDAKLLAAAGAWLGWRALPWTVMLACGAGFAWVGVRWIQQGREGLKRPLPFGAPLAIAFWVVWLYGAPTS